MTDPARKKVSVKLDGETHKRLRQLGLDMDRTNQDMMEQAVKEFLARAKSSW